MMNLTKDEAAKFNKLGINSLIELALLIPHTYEDYRLHNALQPQKPQLIDATVESLYKAPNSIQITFFAHNLGHTAQGVLFRPKPYMLHQFQVGARDYYYGVIDCKQGHCSMSMPKKITQVGKITPKYKTALRNDVMQRLVKTFLTRENLLHVKLKEDVVTELLKLHFPSDVLIQGKEMS
jgi:ATP-dependent DNA helicase RecG